MPLSAPARSMAMAAFAAVLLRAPAAFAVPACTMESEFYPIPSTHQPYALVSGDWNGDGIPDLAAILESPASFCTFMGKGDFTFQTPNTISLSSSPYGIVAGDWNHDGRQDLAVTGDFGTSIYVGDGSGAFTLMTTLPYPGRSLASADLDRDGNPDLVLTQTDQIVFLREDASQSFTASYLSSDEAALRLGDFNEDGLPDLLTAEFGSLTVRLSQGSATFGDPATYTDACDPSRVWDAVATGDVDGDGHLDIVGVSTDPDACAPIFLGKGDGTFTPATAPGVPSVVGRRNGVEYHAGPNYVLLQDLDHDGRAEEIVLTQNPGSEIACGPPPASYHSLAQPVSAIVADFDRDGTGDVAVAGAQGIAIHPGQPNGSFRRNQGRFLSPPLEPRLFDFNNDGILDLLVTEAAHSDVAVALGTADGGFAPPVGAPGDAFEGRDAADVDEDGKLDLILNGDIFPGRGDGTFADPGYHYSDIEIRSLAAGDVNEDGHVDLVGVRADSGAAVYLGHGNGSFDPPRVIGLGVTHVLLVDLDHDGHLDLVGQTPTGIRVVFGDGNDDFAEARDLAGAPWPPAFGDMQGPGVTFVVVSGASYACVAREFIRMTTPFTGTPVIADLNNDGTPDVVTGDSGSIWLGVADTFEPGGWFGPFGEVAIDDRNHDGLPDLIVTRTDNPDDETGSATVILNRTGRSTTGTLLESFTAARVASGVELRWVVASSIQGAPTWVERGTPGVPSWTRLNAPIEHTGAAAAEIDATAREDVSYMYRLMLGSPAGPRELGQLVQVAAIPPRASFGFQGVSPNPSADRVQIAFAVARAGPVAIELFDVSGRRVASIFHGVMTPGSHELDWAWRSLAVRPGVYRLRLSYPGGHDSRWIVHAL